MGCCDSKKKTVLNRPHNCPLCGIQFTATTTVIQVYIFQKQVQLQQHNRGCNVRAQNYVIPIQQNQGHNHIIPIQPLPQLLQPIFVVGSVPGQAVMDDFNNNGILKYFWCKELIAGSKTQYQWVRKQIPPLPEKSIQAFLQIPWATIKGSEFTTKQTWFRLNLEKLRVPWQQGSDSVHVSKESFLMSTLGAVHGINWHKEVKVIIAGEEKVLDAGGLLREWVNLTMKEIIHPESGMFQLAETEDVTYKINSDADPVEHVLDCFRLLGIVVGKAIFERVPLNAFLDRSIIRHMLGQTVFIDDIFCYDKQLYQSWTFLLNNTFDPQELMEYFVIYRKNQGDTYELKAKGAEVMVDNDNKSDYVRLCIDYYTFQSIKPFIQAFLNQLYAIVPKKYLSIFDPIELEMILYGIPFINLEDWKENTEYKGGYYRGHQTIIWFWKVLGDLDQPMLAKFLQFCTGSQRTPVEGFRKLESNRGNCAKFCVESVAYTRANPYPKAHTCFNRLELPIYESQEDVESYLKAIVNNDLDGVFGME